jgi:L-iditol 2-dehydrogenase
LLIGLEIDPHLRELALTLGADIVFDPRDRDLEDKIKTLTQGRGTDKYIECSGNPASLQTAFKLIRKRGRVVVYGVYRQEAVLDFNQVGEFKEFEIVGGHLSPWSYPSVIKHLAEGLIDGQAMVTHHYPLSQFQQALQVKEKEPSIKTILIPGK